MENYHIRLWLAVMGGAVGHEFTWINVPAIGRLRLILGHLISYGFIYFYGALVKTAHGK